MKVHIMGKGMISLLGLNAPVRNIELAEKQIRALVPITTLKVYDAATNVIITKLNVDNFFNVEEPVKVPTPTKKKETKKPVKKEEPIPVEQVAEPVPVVEEVVEAPAVEEPVEEIPVEVNEEAELTSDEEEEVEEEVAEEEPVEKTPTEFVPRKKAKKRR